VYEEFENVHGELDRLANELRKVTSSGVALDAHFTRFGYNATVRSYDGEEEGDESGREKG
jgi:hypothetical protein